uniref:Uncharacterized protein n=1 Tax=Pseudomonas graminis TaxID=158627 RepID=A0A7C2ALX4_9PSED
MPAIGCAAVVNLTPRLRLTHRMHRFTAASRQIAGKRAPTGSSAASEEFAPDHDPCITVGTFRQTTIGAWMLRQKTIIVGVSLLAIGCVAVVNLTPRLRLTHRMHRFTAASRQIASKLTPTGSSAASEEFAPDHDPCITVGTFRQTTIGAWMLRQTKINVGARLPAIGCAAVVNLTPRLRLTHRVHRFAAASRQIASKLTPTVFAVPDEISADHKSCLPLRRFRARPRFM